MRIAILQVDDSDDPAAAQNRHGQKSLEAVLGQVLE